MLFTIIIESHDNKCNVDDGCVGHLIQINSRLMKWEADDWRERFAATPPAFEWHERILEMTCIDETGLIVWKEDRVLDHLFEAFKERF